MVASSEKSAETGKENFPDEPIETGPCYGVRHTQMVLLFILICVGYAMRVNLSVGIEEMTNGSNPNFPVYNWTDKNVILSSFFWGYVIPQIGAGQLAKRYGPRWLLIVAMAACSIFTILVPAMATLGSWGVMICRVVQGFSQGFFYPCTHNMLSRWVPPSERTRLGTFVYAGGIFGTVLALPITGWICGSSIGWPSVFYIFGSIGLGWVVLYIFLGSNSIFEHKSISAEEREYIKTSIGSATNSEGNEVQVKTPWKSIFTSLPVWCILIAHCGQNWGFWTLLTEIPTYMSHILKFDIKSNGLLSALPYFVLWILSFFFGYMSDFMINRNIVKIGTARKITTAIGLLGPAIALTCLGLSEDSDVTMAVALLVVAVGINSATYCGYQVNHIDLAPNQAGTLMGITNGCANVFSIVAPLAVQFIVTDEDNPTQWNTVWFIAAVIYVICALMFILFGSGELQEWDSPKARTEKELLEAEIQMTKTSL